MAIPVHMPTFGMTEGEATIIRWLKQVGESVAADEVLFEAENEKAMLEVPSPGQGVLLSILAHEGQTVALNEAVAWIGDAGEAIPDLSADVQRVAAPTAAGPSGEPEQQPDDGWVKATPIARRLAREHSLELHTIQGSGPGGRVKQADVERVLEQRRGLGAPVTVGAGEASELQPLTTVRRVTAERMAESFRSAPHFYLQVEVRATQLAAIRQALLEDVEARTGVRLSYTDLLLLALARLLPAHPLLNATWDDGQVRTYHDVHLSVAVAGPQGLVVPVIHSAQALSVEALARARHDLAERARQGRLAPADLRGGTFTLTNLGMYGVDAFIPILNPPQSAILAAGAIVERPVGEEGRVALRPTMQLTLAADHRVVDGAQAALFLRDLRALLETPARLLLPYPATI
ncbi:MAG: 2-oxo acid dehydrogenase subunit E2 [Anaerolineales bacterium]|nr:2-oxo acid dehydrogenase subunit E2 [Anaerolineales bacterium]